MSNDERQSAPQQGPIAWLIRYEDADRQPEVFCGEGAEAAAYRRFEQVSQRWNCYLFVSPPNARSPAQPDVVRDALRYRFLRDGERVGHVKTRLFHAWGPALDTVVDANMQQSAQGEKP